MKGQKARLIGVMTAALVLLPTLAFAAEAAAAGGAITPASQKLGIIKFIIAAVVMLGGALCATIAQMKIGLAAAGVISEKPETATMMIVLMALPEIIVLLGFVAALLLINAPLTTLM